MSFMDYIAQEPLWLQAWIYWMMAVNLAALIFSWKRIEPRWVLAAFLGSALLMNGLFALYGYEKILGLAHVIFWTPLLVYLFRRLPDIDRTVRFGQWVIVLMVTNAVSLVLDYIDVVRYILGERT